MVEPRITPPSNRYRFWVGSYTSPAPHVPSPAGKGIYLGEFDSRTGQIELTLASNQTLDPSYLALAPSLLAAVSERPSAVGEVHLYERTAAGTLKFRQALSTAGVAPCHLCFEQGGLYVVNYMSDALIVCQPHEAGWCAQVTSSVSGSGPNTARQKSPHLHQVVWVEGLGQLAVVDLGSDRIRFYDTKLDVWTTTLAVPAGSGPRHLVYQAAARMLYVLTELSGEILGYHLNDDGEWQHSVTQKLPVSKVGTVAPAAIRMDAEGRFLYGSERKAAKIYRYEMCEANQLQAAGALALRGKTPRDFALSPCGAWLLVACQDSDEICSYRLEEAFEPAEREQAPVQSVHCGTPVCLCFE
jgi:6-phosphogluconolactonase